MINLNAALSQLFGGQPLGTQDPGTPLFVPPVDQTNYPTPFTAQTPVQTQQPARMPGPPNATQPAFRTPDLIALIGLALAGRHAGEFAGGYMKAKQQKAAQDTQNAQNQWQFGQQEQSARDSLALEQQKLGQEREIRLGQQQNVLDAAKIRAQGAQGVADTNAGAKRDANRTKTFGIILGAVAPEARPGAIQRMLSLNPNLASDADFMDAVGQLTPKEELQTKQGNFIAGAKTDDTEAGAGLKKAKTTTENQTRSYKIQAYIKSNDLKGAETEYQKAKTDFQKVVTKIYPAEKAALIAKMDAQAQAAIVTANASMYRAQNPRTGTGSAPGGKPLTANFVAGIQKAMGAVDSAAQANQWTAQEMRKRLEKDPNDTAAQQAYDSAYAKLVYYRHQKTALTAQMEQIKKGMSQSQPPPLQGTKLGIGSADVEIQPVFPHVPKSMQGR